MLPRMKLKPGYTGCFRSGRGYKDILALVTDLTNGVRELKGKGVVYNVDYPQIRQFGFQLVLDKNDQGDEEYWEFLISCEDATATEHLLPSKVKFDWRSSKERVRFAKEVEKAYEIPT